MESQKANYLEVLENNVRKINRHLKNLHLIAEVFEIYFFEYERDWEVNVEQFNQDLFETGDFYQEYRICGPKIHIWDFKDYDELLPCIGICYGKQYACVASTGKLLFGLLDNPRPKGDALELIQEGRLESYGLDAEILNKCVEELIQLFVNNQRSTVNQIAEFVATTIPQFYHSYGGGASGVHHDGEGPYIEFLLGLSPDDEKEYLSGTVVKEYRVCRLVVRYWLRKCRNPFFFCSPGWLQKGFNGKEKYIRVARFKNYDGIGFEVEYEDKSKESWLYMDQDWTEKQQYLSEQLFHYMHDAWVHDFGLSFQLEPEWDYDHDRFWGTTREKKDCDLIRWIKKGIYPPTVICNHISNPNIFRQVLGDSEKNKPLLERYERLNKRLIEERKKRLHKVS